ncbi:MAG: type III pantothenate kinase [Chromatiales bacterium]|nr:type III pantothenate kinase [Chromatiales bacterium]
MILLIDIGNSRSRYAMLHPRPAALVEGEVVSNSDGIDALLANISESPTEVYVSCVGAESLMQQVIAWSEREWRCTPVRLQTQSSCCGVINGYLQPERLGVDRWLAMIGAFGLVQGAVLVIDCGTVCTADLVDKMGQHRGGAMVPGIRLMQQAMRSGTAAVKDESELTALWGRSTAESLGFGIQAGLTGYVKQLMAMAATALQGPYTVVLTGGDAALLLGEIEGNVRHDNGLLFHGMAAVVRQRADDFR